MKEETKKVIRRMATYLLIFGLCVPLLQPAVEKTAKAAGVVWWYAVKADGTVEITGVTTSATAIEIPETVDGFKVTGIGDSAFYCSSLKSITIPQGVTRIGDKAFYCSSLESIIIPDSVTSIGNSAFDGCSSLKNIVIPDSVTSIGDYAFFWCSSLESIVIPDSVTSIGDSAFYWCSSLESIVIPDSVTSIGDCAFWCCSSLKSITIPDSVTSIGEGVFWNCPSLRVVYAAPGSVAETYANTCGITVKTDTAINPVVTPTPIPTPSPTLAMGVTFAPIITEQSPTPTPTPTLPPTPTPTPMPTPELGISVNQTELSADAQGIFASNKVEMAVTSAYSCTVSTSDLWLKVCKKDASASADNIIWLRSDSKEWTGSFYVFVNENTSVVPRTGEITITAEYGDKKVKETVVVKQEAAKAALTVSAKKITANAKGKTSVTSVKVDTNKTGGFSVSNNGNSWIKMGSSSYSGSATSNVSFEATGTFYIFVSENPSDEERTGQVTVTHEDGETTETIEVVQEGTKAVLTVDSTSKLVDNNGAFYNNAIYVETSDTGSFTAMVEDAAWLKISSDKFASFADGMSSITLGDNAYIYLFADKNMGEERTATIKITHEGGKLTKTITVTQLGKPASYLQVDRETAYFDDPASAVDGMVHISADENTKWTVTSSAGWIKILKNAWDYEDQYASIEGTGSGGFYIYVKENNTYKERSGYITVSAPGLESYQIYVYQVENEISLDTLLQELSISVTKKTFKKGKTTKIKLNYPEGLYASDIKSVKFSSSKKKVATVNSKGVVKGIKKGKAVITVKVTLENGSSKTFKAKITVDKRKVKLSKFK